MRQITITIFEVEFLIALFKIEPGSCFATGQGKGLPAGRAGSSPPATLQPGSGDRAGASAPQRGRIGPLCHSDFGDTTARQERRVAG